MRRRIGVFVFILALPGVLLAPAWRLAGLGAIEDDVLYYLPMRTLLGELLRSGTPPYFNEWTGLGRPLLADPQTAAFYPPSWLFAALDPLTAYAAVLWLHYSLAAWGAYRLLRSWRLRPVAALFGGLVFAGSGFMLAHRAHFAMVHAAAWTPIVFWRFERYAQRGGLRRLAIAGLVAALQCFAGHVQIAAVTLLGLAAYLALRCERRTAALLRLGLGWLLAAGLFAVQWLPTLVYTFECTRLKRGYLDFTENSYSPVSLVGWVLPFFLGQRRPNFFDQPWWGPSHQVEQFCYIGIVPLVLAAACWRAGPGHDRRLRAAGGLAVFGILLALGLYGPVCPLLYWLPGASLFRVPARALLLVHLAIGMLAASAFDALVREPTPWRARLRYVLQELTDRPVRGALLIVAVCLLPFVMALPLAGPGLRARMTAALNPANPAVWMPVIVLVASLAAVHIAARRFERVQGSGKGEQGTESGRRRGRFPPTPAVLLPAVVTLFDLVVVGWSIDVPAEYRSAAELLNPPRRAEWLRVVKGAGRRAQGEGRRDEGQATRGEGRGARSHGREAKRADGMGARGPRLARRSEQSPARQDRSADSRGRLSPSGGRRDKGQGSRGRGRGALPEPVASDLRVRRVFDIRHSTFDVPRQPWAAVPHGSSLFGLRSSLLDDSRLWVVTARRRGVPGEYIDPLGRGVANTNILLGVRSLTDYGPLQPVRFVERFGFKPWGEAPRARALLEDADWMPRFNVGWVLLCDPQLPPPATGRHVTTTAEGDRLYRIDAPLGAAYVEPLTLRQAVRVERISPHRLRVRVDFDGPTPARLVVSRLAIRGWQATLDGEPVKLTVAHGCLLAAPLARPGTHTLELWYEPPGLWAGFLVTLASAAVAAGCIRMSNEE